MSEQSTNLQFPFLQAGQAQKHVTVNESLLRLDALVQLSAVSASVAVEPATPVDGSIYILPSGKSGAHWGAMAVGALAYYRDGVWEQISPLEGWIAWVEDVNEARVFDGAAWSQSSLRTGLGLGTAATKNTGVSGAVVPLTDGANIWSGANRFNARARVVAGGTTHPALGAADGGVQISNSGDINYGLLMGVRGSGDAWLQVQRSDGTATAYDLVLQPSGGGVKFGAHAAFHGGASALPTTDNTYNLGSASFRFGTVYAATGTINTSDAREKTALAPIPPGVKRAVATIMNGIGSFQRTDAIAEKGAGSARLHVGVTAQAVRDAFLAEGEDPARWGLFCVDPLVETIETKRTRKALRPLAADAATIDAPGAPAFEEVEIEEMVSETLPVLDENGEPIIRLGLRYDELTMLMLASLSA